MTTSPCGHLLSCDDMALPRERFRERLVEIVSRTLNLQQTIDPTAFDGLLKTPDDWRLADYVDVILTAYGTALDSQSMPSGIEIT